MSGAWGEYVKIIYLLDSWKSALFGSKIIYRYLFKNKLKSYKCWHQLYAVVGTEYKLKILFN